MLEIEIIDDEDGKYDPIEIAKKGRLIGSIISHLRFEALRQNEAIRQNPNKASWEQKEFSESDIFFSLCFKSDDELKNIARLAGI